MRLLGSSKRLINTAKNGKNVSNLEVVELVLVQCNQYQPESEVLHTFLSSVNLMLICYMLNQAVYCFWKLIRKSLMISQ